MYFPFFGLHDWRKRSAAQPQKICSEFPKFPGGGIERGERPVDAMIRETREEAGLIVLLDSVREYGYVHRIQKSDQDETECFVQDNYYFLCRTEETIAAQALDDYEKTERFTLEYVDPMLAIRKNRRALQTFDQPMMLEREARVLGSL